jgi:hypothetical protein
MQRLLRPYSKACRKRGQDRIEKVERRQPFSWLYNRIYYEADFGDEKEDLGQESIFYKFIAL